MKEQFTMIGLIILVLCVSLSGCEQVNNTNTIEKTKFVGTWQNTTVGLVTILDIFSDGTCTLLSVSGTWDVRDDKFVMEFTDSRLSSTYTYVFSDNDRTLSLTSQYGLTTVYTKQ